MRLEMILLGIYYEPLGLYYEPQGLYYEPQGLYWEPPGLYYEPLGPPSRLVQFMKTGVQFYMSFSI